MYMEHNGQTLYCLGFSIPISRVNGYTVYKFSDVNNYTEEQKVYKLLHILDMVTRGYEHKLLLCSSRINMGSTWF